jgi:hypothetical protein
MERAYTDFLTPDCTFLIGAGSVFALDGSNFFYNRSGNRVLADARAIHQDFVMVGQDVADVVAAMAKEEKKQLDLPL